MNNPFEQINEEFHSIKEMLNELIAISSKNPHSKELDDQILSVIEASEILRLSVPTIYSKVNRGELPAMKKGRRLYFSQRELLEYLKEGKRLSKSDVNKEVEAYLANKRKG